MEPTDYDVLPAVQLNSNVETFCQVSKFLNAFKTPFLVCGGVGKNALGCLAILFALIITVVQRFIFLLSVPWGTRIIKN